MHIVSVSEIEKSFGAERVFTNISFSIDEHDRIGLVAPNGAGKTTLLDLLAGYAEPDEGSVSVARHARVGYLTQHADFQPDNTLREEMLTVFEQVRAWERELEKLALQLADPDILDVQELHEQRLERYAD